MRSQRIVAIISAASMLLSSAGAFAQAERNQELLDQRARDQARGFPNGDPRSGDATTPSVIDRRGNVHEVRPTPNGGAVVGPALPGNYSQGGRTDGRTDRYGNRNDQQYQQRSDQQYQQRNDQQYQQHNDSRYDPRYYQRYDNGSNRYVPGDRFGGDWRGRGAGPSNDWYRGGRLPSEYRSRQYVVDDWRSHRLYEPPHGYHWVQAGGDYVLAAIATGVIAAILLNQ